MGADKFGEGRRRSKELPSEGLSPPSPHAAGRASLCCGREVGSGLQWETVWRNRCGQREKRTDRGAPVGRQTRCAGPSTHYSTCVMVTQGPETRVGVFGLLCLFVCSQLTTCTMHLLSRSARSPKHPDRDSGGGCSWSSAR